MQTDGHVTAAKLKNAYIGIGVKQETLLKLFEPHNVEFEKKVGYSRTKDTFGRYRTVCKHIRELLSHIYYREDIPLKELNLTFINDFEYFLREEKKCRTNTLWGYMTELRHIISGARNTVLLSFNPFAGYIKSSERVDRSYLTEEIQTLIEAPMKTKPMNWCATSLFFRFFRACHMRMGRTLPNDNLKPFFDGTPWIITRRRKTNTDSNIRLLDIPKRIIEKYKGLSDDDRVFTMLSNSCCNEKLKKIGNHAVSRNCSPTILQDIRRSPLFFIA